ncbi:rho GTPase-activating protein SYDE1 isoform X2 [Engraulis encrasicolus]|uniref:rho GTPase-activating protein SYDE1 isoform X2 n=1 Tax=Engraulis encrasicolus TaxID=184585 RepID=UPI002FCF19B5
MAEPLLKRTFSRLRGKEKFRRKTDPKLADVHSKGHLVQSSSSSTSSVLTFTGPDVDSALAEDFSRRTQITVAKKQNWAKQAAAASREHIHSQPARVEAASTHGLAQRAQERENLSGKPQASASASSKAQASGSACSQRTLREDSEDGGGSSRCSDFEWEPVPSSPLWDSIDMALPELAPPPPPPTTTAAAVGYVEVSTTSSSSSTSTVRQAGHGAYLQHLERSSRAWVLSTGKTQASDHEASSSSRLLASSSYSHADRRTQNVNDGEANIWYNPIPEEEDFRGVDAGSEYGDPWRKRAGEMGVHDTQSSRALKPGVGLTSSASNSNNTRGALCAPPSSAKTIEVVAEIACSSSNNSSRKESPDISHQHRGHQQVQETQQLVPGPSTSTSVSAGGSSNSSSSTSVVAIPAITSDPATTTTTTATTTTTNSKKSSSSVSGSGAGGGSSMMDRIKSPGTVRRLSMKMRKLPELRRKLSLRSSRSHRHHGNPQGGASSSGAACGDEDEASPPNARKESSNVISRYHLDSSAPPARPRRRASRARSADKGGYLSDGDSPELLPKQQGGSDSGSQYPGDVPPPPSHHHQPGGGGGQEGQAAFPVADASSFRMYSLADQPRCAQRMSGLLTVHLMGVDELTRSGTRSGGGGGTGGGDGGCSNGGNSKEVFCAIQVDGVTRARTALLTCRGAALPLNHTFNLELERARLLKLVVLTPVTSPSGAGTGTGTGGGTTTGQQQQQNVNGSTVVPTRNRVCCLGAVAIPPLFRGSRCQQLCVRLEPRGLLYVKLTLLEQWESPAPRLSELPPPSVFGVELRLLVEKEGSALPVPLIIQKCVAEIEKRGLKGVGLYRLCGSAAVKKELRDAFERDSAAVTLNEDLYPDVNVITGILKDYLRELPSPLITRTLYEVVLEAQSLRPACRSDADTQRRQSTVSLLHCLPEPEKATLTLLLDHLSLVASFSDSNRMTCQNLAVCFGPVLLTPTQESWMPAVPGGGPGGASLMTMVPPATAVHPAASHNASGRIGGGRSFAHSEDIASAVDFKRHIEVLHYLLQLWPIPTDRVPDSPSDLSPPPPITTTEHAPPSPSPVLPLHTTTTTTVPSHNAPLQRRGQRLPLPLRLEMPQEGVVSRRGRGRLESPPCNRYAGDWSLCGRDFLSGGRDFLSTAGGGGGVDVDYDEVAGSDSDDEDSDDDDDDRRGGRGAAMIMTKDSSWSHSQPSPAATAAATYIDDFDALDFDAPFSCRLSLKDFDTLISDLERELSKQINICL